MTKNIVEATGDLTMNLRRDTWHGVHVGTVIALLDETPLPVAGGNK
jgi:hypothetical protein